MSRVVVHHEAFEAWKIARTMHALASLDVHNATIVARHDLPAALAHGDAVWLLSAGAVPRSAAFPPSSATGKPLIALGATRDFEGRCEPAWESFLRETGGSLESPHVALPSPASVYAERADVAAPLFMGSDPWSHEARPSRSFEGARVVHVPALDVAFSQRLRVVLVVTTLHRGGAERVVLDLFRELPARGVDVVLCVFDPPKRETYEAPPGTILLYEHHRTRRDRIAALARGARSWGADMVHAHLLDAAELDALRAAGIRAVATVHNARAGWPAGYERPGALDLLFGCSLATTRELRAARPDALVRTAWNGIDAKPFSARSRESALHDRARIRRSLGLAETATVLVSVANPRPQKRTERLVETLSRLVERGHDAHLVLVGGTGAANASAQAAQEALDRAIAALGLGMRVHAAGTQRDVAAHLAAADVFVSASEYEGLSLAQLEAVAAGLPLVLSRVGGTEELAGAHATSVTLVGESTSAAFADAIEAVIARPASAAATLSSAFTRGAMADRHAVLYGRIVAQPSLAARRPRRADVVLVTNNFSTGGAQSSARRLLGALRARGVSVRAAVIEEQARFPTPGREALEREGISVHVAPRAGLNDPRVTAENVAHVIDEAAPRAVVFWNAIAEHKVLLADMLLGSPVFDVSPGEMYFRSLARYFERPRAGLPYLKTQDYGSLLAGAIVKFGGEERRARDVLGAPVTVIPNGVHVPEHPVNRRARSGPLAVGTLARIGPDKKLEELLDAFRMARPHLPPCTLHIAGAAETGFESYARALQESAADLGPSVVWTGERASAEFLAEMDLFALVAEPEGCPNASLEAMAAALPVIATRVGGMSEQVVHGETGYLTPRGDPRALAEAMILALGADATARMEMGLAGYARARATFSLERMAERYATTLGL